MKQINFILAALITMMISTSVFAQEQAKMGYVDLSRLFDEYHKTKEYDKVLEGKNGEYEKARNAKIEKIREVQDKMSLLAEDKRKESETELETLKAELLEYDRQSRADLTKDRNEKIREILLEIEKKVSEFAEREKYSIILNDRVLIYGNPAMEVTEQIMKTLNENAPAVAK